jgi:hypothetical protein
MEINDAVMNILKKQCFQAYLKNKEEVGKIKEQHRIKAIKLALYYFEMKLPVFKDMKILVVGINYIRMTNKNIYVLCQGKTDQQVIRFRQRIFDVDPICEPSTKFAYASALSKHEYVWLHPVQEITNFLFRKLHISHLVVNIITFVINK